MSEDRNVAFEAEEELQDEEAAKINPQEDSEDGDEIKLSKEEYEKLLKKVEVGETYKQENEKYRHQNSEKREKAVVDSAPKVESSNKLLDDFNSKAADVYHDYRGQIESLSDSEWSSISGLIKPALNQVYEEAKKNSTFVARGALSEKIQGLLEYAKGGNIRQEELEKSRAEGIKEQQKYENAEISGIKSKNRNTSDDAPDVLEIDKKMAETRGSTPERERDIRINREKRLKEYSV